LEAANFNEFDTNISSTILEENITELENAGFPVIAIVSDMGPNNMKLWKEYGICSVNTFIVKPADSKSDIYFLPTHHIFSSLSETISLIMVSFIMM
jgi:hypothetical protein